MSGEPTGTPDAAAARRRNIIIGAVVIALVVVGGVIWLTTRGDSSPTPSATGGSSSASASPTPSLTPLPSPSATGKRKNKKPVPQYTGAVTTKKPQKVAFHSTGRPGEGLVVTIAKVESITSKAVTVGEVGGPALRITVAVHNQGPKSVQIYSALTNLYYGPQKSPADPAHEPGGKAFPPTVGPGKTVTGVVLYTIATKNRTDLDLEVNLDNRLRTLEFSGGCPQDC